MKVGDLIRVLPVRVGWSSLDGQLGVIIVGPHRAVVSRLVGAHIMLTDGSKVWLETKRLEVQSESG
tara:strand:- start:443 stop:640 length:198 start_codon:yes stop_codon:yes gene_type:complete